MTIAQFLKKFPEKKFYETAFYQKYLFALNRTWNGEHEKALEYIGDVINSDIEHMHVPLFYRLWLEVLSIQNDRASLEVLKNHLTHASDYFESYLSLVGIRGLIHLELDELEACHLLLRGLEEEHNPYAAELRQRVNFRYDSVHAGSKNKFGALFECKAPIVDFMTMKHAANALLLGSHFTELNKILSKISMVFPDAPLENEFRFFEALDKNDLTQCLNHSSELYKAFPKQHEYALKYAYSLYCMEKFEGGNKVLEDLHTDHSLHNDTDVLSLLGYGNLMLSKDNQGSKHWKQARTYFEWAKKKLAHNGMPTSEVELNLSFMDERQNGKNALGPAEACWLQPLSPRRYAELSGSPEAELDYLFRDLGPKVNENDVILMSSDDKHLKRLAAVYRVVKKPVWHPTQKHHAILELVCKFDRSLPLDLELPASELHKLEDKTSAKIFDIVEETFPIRERMQFQHHHEREHQWQLRKFPDHAYVSLQPYLAF